MMPSSYKNIPLTSFIDRYLEQLNTKEREAFLQPIYNKLVQSTVKKIVHKSKYYQENWTAIRFQQNIRKIIMKERDDKKAKEYIQQKREEKREIYFRQFGEYPPENKSDFELEWRLHLLHHFPQAKVAYNAKPRWLKRVWTDGQLEYDIFFYEWNIAVEVNGPQHYRIVKKYHPNGKKDLLDQVDRDECKKTQSIIHGVHLISIAPWDNEDEKIEKIKQLLLK